MTESAAGLLAPPVAGYLAAAAVLMIRTILRRAPES
jgi:hypothetical protein